MKQKSSDSRLPIIEWIEQLYMPVFMEWIAAMGAGDETRQRELKSRLDELKSHFPYSEMLARMEKGGGGLWAWIKSLMGGKKASD